MKLTGKYILSIAMLLSICTIGLSQKIAYINSAEILQAMPEVKAADSELEALSKQLQKKGEEMITAFQQKVGELQQKEQSGDLSPKQIQDEAAKLEGDREALAKFEQDMQIQLGNKRQELYQPILDKVNDIIEKKAKEGGIQIVFNYDGSILYADESTNMTAQVKTDLGL